MYVPQFGQTCLETAVSQKKDDVAELLRAAGAGYVDPITASLTAVAGMAATTSAAVSSAISSLF